MGATDNPKIRRDQSWVEMTETDAKIKTLQGKMTQIKNIKITMKSDEGKRSSLPWILCGGNLLTSYPLSTLSLSQDIVKQWHGDKLCYGVIFIFPHDHITPESMSSCGIMMSQILLCNIQTRQVFAHHYYKWSFLHTSWISFRLVAKESSRAPLNC